MRVYKRKQKYPDKTKVYHLGNFLKQFSDILLVNPYVDFDDDCVALSNYMFETYGQELDLVKSNTNGAFEIWTVRDNNDGRTMKIDFGFGFVNRFGYFLVKKTN